MPPDPPNDPPQQRPLYEEGSFQRWDSRNKLTLDQALRMGVIDPNDPNLPTAQSDSPVGRSQRIERQVSSATDDTTQTTQQQAQQQAQQGRDTILGQPAQGGSGTTVNVSVPEGGGSASASASTTIPGGGVENLLMSPEEMVGQVTDAVGPLSEFIAADGVRTYEAGTLSDEERQAMVEEGVIPVAQTPELNYPELQPIQLDLSRSKEAVEEFAEAKVQAAKQGSLMSRAGAEAANTRLLLNALGPTVTQLISGTQQPASQQMNMNRAAARSLRNYRQQLAQQQRVERLAPAQADVKQAEMSAQEQRFNQQQRRQTTMQQFNIDQAEARQELRDDQRVDQQLLSDAQRRQNLASEAALSQIQNRQSMRVAASRREQKQQEAAQYGQQYIDAMDDYIEEVQVINKLKRRLNELAPEFGGDLSDKQQQELNRIKNIIAQYTGVQAPSGIETIMDQGVGKLTEKLESRAARLEQDLEQNRRGFMDFLDDVGYGPFDNEEVKRVLDFRPKKDIMLRDLSGQMPQGSGTQPVQQPNRSAAGGGNEQRGTSDDNSLAGYGVSGSLNK